MMNWMWAIMGAVGIVWGLIAGKGASLTEQSMRAAMDAVQLCVRLAGGFALWSGLIAILEKGGAMESLARTTKPMLSRLFPGANESARESIAMNLTANMLGLGNAATPMGLEAMRAMAIDATDNTATDAMCMFLVINASSVQLFPTTVIALRAAAGSSAPASILTATLISTAISTIAGVAACFILRSFRLERGAEPRRPRKNGAVPQTLARRTNI
jgi:spore maturation protein A